MDIVELADSRHRYLMKVGSLDTNRENRGRLLTYYMRGGREVSTAACHNAVSWVDLFLTHKLFQRIYVTTSTRWQPRSTSLMNDTSR